MQMQLNDGVLRAMGIGRVFKENDGRINSIDFHRTEDLLVTAGDDDSVRLYNTATGVQQEALFSRKYGVQQICFTHHSNAVVYASNKDKMVRLWDLRTPACQGLLQVPGQPTAAFDQQGLVFAVATESGILKLYDVRSYEKGPFDTFVVQDETNSPVAFSCLEFSNDGKMILAVVEGRIYLLDAFAGQTLHRFSSGVPEGGSALQACFSADAQYILSGCEDRAIRVWSVTGQEVAVWAGHAGTPACLQWAPRRLLVASACNALALWIPDLSRLEMPPQQQQMY